MLRALWQLCRKLKVDLWHAHDHKTDALGVLLQQFWPIKLVTTLHGYVRRDLRTRFYYRLDNLCLPWYDHIIAVSPKLVEHCLSRGVSHQRLTYVPNAIDPDEYRRKDNLQQIRRELDIQDDRFMIGVVSRLTFEKGVDRAIRVFANLHKRYSNTELHVIGDGTQINSIRALARELGVADVVRFWGWQTDVQRFYEIMDTMLLPSRTEGLPNVALEAMSMAIPVAATDVGAVRELLDNGRCGVVLEPDSISTWCDQIAPLVVSPERRTVLAQRARQHIQRHYTFERRMAKVSTIYERLLGLAPATARAVRRAG